MLFQYKSPALEQIAWWVAKDSNQESWEIIFICWFLPIESRNF